MVGAIIGERPVNNLFGLDGSTVHNPVPVPVNVALPPIPFNDLGDLNFPLGATPKAASEELGVNGTLTVRSASGGEAAFPARLGLANPELDLTLTDGSGAPSVRQQFQSEAVTVTFNKSNCEASETGTVCTYQAAEPEYYFFPLALEGQDFETLFNDILQAGATTNNATGTVTLVVSSSLENVPPVPLDSSFTLVLETRNGKIKFF